MSLVMAKNHLCPSAAKLTVPRAELCAAVMSVHLVTEVLRELEVHVSQVTYWTDSILVLGTIRSTNKRFQLFIANRVAEIRHLTDPEKA